MHLSRPNGYFPVCKPVVTGLERTASRSSRELCPSKDSGESTSQSTLSQELFEGSRRVDKSA